VQRIAQLAGYLVVRTFICVLQALPLETCQRLATVLAGLACDRLGIRQAVIDDNLRHAYPELNPAQRLDLTRRMWRHLFLLIAEIAHAPRRVRHSNWRKFVRIQGDVAFVRSLLSDRPMVIISGHFGNFELAGYVLGILGFPSYTVARTLDNPYLNDYLNRFRGRTGQHMIPKKGGYARIVRVLSSGGTMAFLADQYAGSKGCWVQFFGRPVSTHKALALLALEHDALVAAAGARRGADPLQYELSVDAILDSRTAPQGLHGVRELTQWYTSELEALIRRAPDQYWWLHRRWKDKRAERHQTRRAA